MCPASRPASACVMYASVCCGSGTDVNHSCQSSPSAAALASAPPCPRVSGPRPTPWASDGTDHCGGGMWEMVPAVMRVAPRVAEAFEKGGGVPFADFGPDCVNALDLINRGQYDERFASYWLKSLPEVVARLQAGGRMLDFGCGSGRVAMAIKRAFPAADVAGFDIDAQSLARARDRSKNLSIAIMQDMP